jgi:hypothetical protein
MRVQGNLTKVGAVAFERHRARITRQTGRAQISDADVIEWLARAMRATPCPEYRPAQSGDCVLCDEPAEAHLP